jgi:hypothetical protein
MVVVVSLVAGHPVEAELILGCSGGGCASVSVKMRDFAMSLEKIAGIFCWKDISRMIWKTIDGLIHGNRDDDEQAMLNQTKLVPSGKLEAGEIGRVRWLPSSSPFQLPIEPVLFSFHDLDLCPRRLRPRQRMLMTMRRAVNSAIACCLL